MRAHHDMGGEPAGSVTPTEHDYSLWEKRTDALMMLLSDQKRQLLRVDQLRRAIEQLGPQAYDRMSYYERWIASITQNMLERGVFTAEELGRKMAAVETRLAGERKVGS